MLYQVGLATHRVTQKGFKKFYISSSFSRLILALGKSAPIGPHGADTFTRILMIGHDTSQNCGRLDKISLKGVEIEWWR